jgi:serine/threonine protein kinase
MQENFSQYHLTTELAQKHSHSTYLASPVNEPERQVVLIIFSASLYHFPHEREKLLLKARRIKELKHLHLAPILDMGIENEQPFVVREYLPGESLRSRLKKSAPHRLELRDALTIVSQVGQALAYAHKHIIFHGNLKPENILFDVNDQAVLTDFYIGDKNDILIRDQTKQEYALCYLAPEQFASTCDSRSDQYALGCLAYELITGQMPFAAQTLASIMGHYHNTPSPPLSEKVPHLPPSLDIAVLKALNIDPSERFLDLSLFLEVIRSVLAPPPTFPIVRSTRVSRQRW